MLRRACLLCRSSHLTDRRPLANPFQTRIPAAVSSVQGSVQTRGLNTPNDGFDKQGSYEGPGKTTVTILNQEITGINLIDSYSRQGFRLNDNTFLIGPSIVLPTAVLRWNVMSASDVSIESLSLFTLLDPKLDLIIIGHGQPSTVRDPVDIRVLLAMKKKGIMMEILETEKAISTYNYLMGEGRVVAAALIPPLYTKKQYLQDNVENEAARDELFKFESNPFAQSPTAKREFMRNELRQVKEAHRLLDEGKGNKSD